MAISSPYADSEMVALLQRNLLLGATDFTPTSKLPKTTIDQFIAWTSAAIEMQLGQAGYIIPLQDLSGETWPVHQTAYLQLVTCLGAIRMISPTLRPAPEAGRGRGGSGNIFQDLFDLEMNRIYDRQSDKTQLRFRAKFYLGTPAEKALREPASPKSDFSRDSITSGNVDPAKRLSFWDYTILQNRLVNTFKTDLNWLQLVQLDLTGNAQATAYSATTGYQ